MDAVTHRYDITTDGVFWDGRRVRGADPTTFEPLGNVWGQDANRVFVMDTAKKVDRASFVLLNNVYGKDANGVYDWEGQIKKADSATFEILDAGFHVEDSLGLPFAETCNEGYARDVQNVYFQHQMEGRATVVRGADPASFESFGNGFGRDRRAVFAEKSRIKGADPKTWVLLGRGYSLDANLVFYGDRPLEGADRQTFTVVTLPVTRNLARDRERCYWNWEVISEDEFWKHLDEGTARLHCRVRSRVTD